MYFSRGSQRLFIVVAIFLVATPPMLGSAARNLHPSLDLLDSWEPRPISTTTKECVASPLWSREVDGSTYEFGCEEIEAMLDGTAEMVGQGAVREVFRVEYRGRTLVVKRVSASWKDAPEDEQRHIQGIARREMIALDAVRGNPNVVGMLGVCETDFVAEYLPVEMSEFIRNEQSNGQTTSLSQIVGLALGAARGVQALHEAPGGPIVHFDIKSEQFLVDGDGVAKIDDLNLAWFMGTVSASAEGSECPFTSGRKATSPYHTSVFRPPEYIACQPLTEKVDIFSLAIIFYEIMSETMTHCGRIRKRNNPKDLVPPAVEMDPTCPIGFAQIIEAMWNPNPEERPSAGEVVSRLEALLELLLQE